MKILGIDIGGTTIKIGLVENKKIIDRITIDTDKTDIFGCIKRGVPKEFYDGVSCAGISIPGFVDHKNNVVTLSGNLELNNYNVNNEFKKHFDFKSFVINDANAATLGEYWVGAGSEFNSIIFYTIGTGVGGGVVMEGKLIYGENGYAGEFGHGGSMQNQYECTCGLSHCIEALSSATGIEKLLSKHFNKETKIKSIVENVEDKEIQTIFKTALSPLADHISIMETALNPSAVIIGGGPSAIGKPLIDLISNLVSERQLSFIHETTPIIAAQTKNDAGIFGAAYWALQNLK